MPSKGATLTVLFKRVDVAGQCGLGGAQLTPGGSRLGAGLHQRSFALRQGGDVGVVGRLLGVVFRLGDQLGLVQRLRPLPIQQLLIEIGLGVGDRRFGRLFRSQVGGYVRIRGPNAGLLGVHAGLGLHTLHRGQHLPLLHVVAFLDVQVGDAAEGGGSDVDVSLGFDLPRPADDGDQVLPNNLGSKYLGIAGLGANDGEAGDTRRHQDRA